MIILPHTFSWIISECACSYRWTIPPNIELPSTIQNNEVSRLSYLSKRASGDKQDVSFNLFRTGGSYYKNLIDDKNSS